MKNCFENYAKGDAVLLAYHDEEWGKPCRDEKKLIEMFILELFQAGLSWKTILYKREAFRKAFDNFDIHLISQYDEEKINACMNDPSIIRNRRKIEGMVINAKIILSLQEEYGSFKRYIWHFTQNKTIYEEPSVTQNALSDDISKDLKKRGMKFAGSVTIYSFLQAVGIIYSHTKDCDRYKKDHAYRYLKNQYIPQDQK